MASTGPPSSKQASKKKTIYQLDTPFSSTEWPSISQEDQDTILELLCNLLGPIGHHRRAHIKTSRGKRAAKRKQDREVANGSVDSMEAKDPPRPTLNQCVDVGFNTITKNLAASSTCPYTMVFVSRGNQSSAFNSHFPQMVGLASTRDTSGNSPVRLVGFSKPCSEKLSACLGLARVSALGIRKDADGLEALTSLVREKVPEIHVPWYEEAKALEYHQTRINALETSVGPKKVKST